MRRFFALLLCLCLLPLPAGAAGGEKYVALTFDDGPSGRFTRNLLKGLKEREVRATFFLCGYRMEQFPELTERIFREGHEIGCHGYSHQDMASMSRRDVAQEVGRMRALLPQGCRVAFLRPPGGRGSDAVTQVARVQGLSILSWSVDPMDWAVRDAWAVEKEVLRQVKDGDVILLHDMSDSSVQAALDIVDNLKSRGFTFVTASQLARLRGIQPKPGTLYTNFPAGESLRITSCEWGGAFQAAHCLSLRERWLGAAVTERAFHTPASSQGPPGMAARNFTTSEPSPRSTNPTVLL